MVKKIRRLKKITNRWQRTERIMSVSINGRLVKKKVPVMIRKIRGKYQIKKITLRKRGPKHKVRSSSQSSSRR